jgi:hypothetical protein
MCTSRDESVHGSPFQGYWVKCNIRGQRFVEMRTLNHGTEFNILERAWDDSKCFSGGSWKLREKHLPIFERL